MADQQQTDDDEVQQNRPEAVQTEREIPFAGLTRFNEADLPETAKDYGSSMKWWATERWGTDEEDDAPDVPIDLRGFNTAIRDLPRAALARAAWIHPQTGEVIDTGKHNAVINPEVVQQLSTRDEIVFGDESEHVGSPEEAEDVWGSDWYEDHVVGDDALWQIAGHDYQVANPMDFLHPLAEVVQDRDLDDAMFGEFRLFRSGGKVSADILFNGQHVDVPGRDEGKRPIVVGFQVDWDHFGGTRIHAQGMAMNYECVNSFRNITDRVSVKHVGNLNERSFMVGDTPVNSWYEVWDTLFDRIDEKRDQLAQMIRAAMDLDLDDVFDELPEDFASEHNGDILRAFYDYAGLPNYAVEDAARDARANAEDPYNPDWWTLHSGATYAISRAAESGRFDQHADSAMDDHVQIANDMLFNPFGMGDVVDEEYRESREDERLSEEGGGIAQIVRDEEDVSEAAERFREWEDEMRALTAPEGA